MRVRLGYKMAISDQSGLTISTCHLENTIRNSNSSYYTLQMKFFTWKTQGVALKWGFRKYLFNVFILNWRPLIIIWIVFYMVYLASRKIWSKYSLYSIYQKTPVIRPLSTARLYVKLYHYANQEENNHGNQHTFIN